MTQQKRPVWLLSMDSDQFYAAPTTTGGLKAWYLQYGQQTNSNHIDLVHFNTEEDIKQWLQDWQHNELETAKLAAKNGVTPVLGLSFYTWNAAEFLDVIQKLKALCPELFIMVGGPHVQQAEDYLFDDPIDVVILGEGEITFSELLDNIDGSWRATDGIAYLDAGTLIKTTERQRIKDLDIIPSAYEILELTDSDGQPLYESASYETSRGCPYKCAFCEWGTGAIGTKMNQFSMDRIRRDWDIITQAGIRNIWLADSNFGALKTDLEKTELICELKNKTGLPATFATSWSKKHSKQVQEIVLMLNANGLLPHYQLALQTLTPLALELSHRKNMAANKYEPIAKAMAVAGVPIAAELIWGLPGDNLADFETNLDQLLAKFPNINIFGYTLLPGTEFYEKRMEYEIKTIPVAGYGKAKGEYVVGCHTFSEQEGIEGYFLISAHMILIHGHITPLLIRYLAMRPEIPATPLLRKILAALITEFAPSDIDLEDKMAVYEARAQLYLGFLADLDRTYAVIESLVTQWLAYHQADATLIREATNIISLDHAFCPREGTAHQITLEFEFDPHAAAQALDELELPDFNQVGSHRVKVDHPGGVGEVLKDPDGGSWVRGRLSQIEQVQALSFPA